MTLPPLPWRSAASEGDLDAAFEAERRSLVRLRVRAVGLLALPPLAVATAVNCYAFWDHDLAHHLATLALQSACVLAAIVLTFAKAAERFARSVAMALAIAVATCEFWAIAISSTDADLMLSAALAIMLVPSLTFPWGLGPQALVTCYTAAGYLAIVPWAHLDAARIGNIVIGTLIGCLISTGGAFILDRQRRATFVERHRVAALAHQRELMLDVGRHLNSTMDIEALGTLIARLGQQVLDCDAASTTLVTPGNGPFRVVAVTRGREDVARYEFPASAQVPELAALLDRQGVAEIPGDLDMGLLRRVGHRYGVGHSLVVGIRRDGRRLGLISFNQRTETGRFTEPQKDLAEGIANQAAIALANARLVEDLQRASRVKSEFLSTMSHELRTPLNVILGYAEIGRDAEIDPSVHGDYFAKIENAGRDLLDLIDSTLAIGRLEANRDAVEITTVPLPGFWATLHGVCERFPRAAEVALEWMDVQTVAVPTDARKLEVVVRNLVGNALKFTSHGHVRVTAGVTTDRQLVITVADTGIGIRPQDQGRIFEMFSQADSSDSRRFGGTGLGLYIVRQYVQQLGGAIALESALGRGAVFTVTLPLAIDVAARAA